MLSIIFSIIFSVRDKRMEKVDFTSSDLATLKSSKKQILNFVGPRQNSNFKLRSLLGIKLFTCLRVTFSHLKNKFARNVQVFTLYVVFVTVVSLPFTSFSTAQIIHSKKDTSVIKMVLFGKSNFKDSLNKELLTLPLDSYYQQSALPVLYFQADLSHSITLQYLFPLFYLILLCPLLIWFLL